MKHRGTNITAMEYWWQQGRWRMTIIMGKDIIDVCCGGRMFWFNKENKDVLFMDRRSLRVQLCDGRFFNVKPDFIGDFRNIPFPDNSFSLAVFDPPHLIHAGEKSWLSLKYGVLESTWKDDISKGFKECFRILKPNGILVFKWSEVQIPLKEILKLVSEKPLFENKQNKCHWLVFMKRKEKNQWSK